MDVADPSIIAVMKDLVGFIEFNGRGATLEDIQIGNTFSKSWLSVADLEASGISQLLRLSGTHLRILRLVLTAGELPDEVAKKVIGRPQPRAQHESRIVGSLYSLHRRGAPVWMAIHFPLTDRIT